MFDDFRITFFFGPDNLPERPDVLVCVFNVKKRSWKGGVQVGVEVTEDHLKRLRDRGQLDELIEMIRAKVEPEDFADYEQQAKDLFTQRVCWTKLDLLIVKGIRQENQTIPADAMVEELDREILVRPDAIRQAILTQLDL